MTRLNINPREDPLDPVVRTNAAIVRRAKLENAIARLPKWAQEHIDGLVRDRDQWRKIAEHNMGAETSISATWSPRSVNQPNAYLPDDSSVRFRLTQRHCEDFFDFRKEQAHGRSRIYVMAARPIAVELRSSNVCHLDFALD